MPSAYQSIFQAIISNILCSLSFYLHINQQQCHASLNSYGIAGNWDLGETHYMMWCTLLLDLGIFFYEEKPICKENCLVYVFLLKIGTDR